MSQIFEEDQLPSKHGDRFRITLQILFAAGFADGALTVHEGPEFFGAVLKLLKVLFRCKMQSPFGVDRLVECLAGFPFSFIQHADQAKPVECWP